MNMNGIKFVSFASYLLAKFDRLRHEGHGLETVPDGGRKGEQTDFRADGDFQLGRGTSVRSKAKRSDELEDCVLYPHN